MSPAPNSARPNTAWPNSQPSPAPPRVAFPHMHGIVQEARGSWGSLWIFSRNDAGMYFRKYVKPNQPGTTPQTDARAAFATASLAWQTITPEQRLAWNVAAPIHKRRGKRGKLTKQTGQLYFMHLNVARARAGQPLYNVPPTA